LTTVDNEWDTARKLQYEDGGQYRRIYEKGMGKALLHLDLRTLLLLLYVARNPLLPSAPFKASLFALPPCPLTIRDEFVEGVLRSSREPNPDHHVLDAVLLAGFCQDVDYPSASDVNHHLLTQKRILLSVLVGVKERERERALEHVYLATSRSSSELNTIVERFEVEGNVDGREKEKVFVPVVIEIAEIAVDEGGTRSVSVSTPHERR
jgi:hypothetical protein